MGLWARLFPKDSEARRRELAKDLSVVWSGLVETAPEGTTLDEIVEEYGSRIPLFLAKFYRDLFDALPELGEDDKLRRIAMEGILLARNLSDAQLAEVRRAMGL